MEQQVIMNQLSYPILSTLIFLPILGALLILLTRRSWELLAKSIALGTSILTFLLSIPLFTEFDKTTHKMQFAELHSWIPNWNIHYFLGVDGISILLVLLSTLTSILCVLISWESITKKVKEFYISILLTTSFMIGVFCSLDFFLFYLFWEAMLIPMFLIVGVWGGPNRIYAAIKFFLYTLVGSVLMLVGIIVLYLYAGKTFDILELTTKTYPYTMQVWLFWAFFSAFAVKVPMFPVHTWLPDAHTEAPTAGSVILAAILIKMGAYGFLRFSIPLFPDAAVAMTPAMLNHGVVTGALFLSVGIVYERTHTRMIADYGGLATPMPIYAAFFMVFTLSSIGLPATNGFIGEFLILLGGFTANKLAGVLACTGIIIGAGYMLWLYQKIFFVSVNPKIVGLPDMDIRETITLVPLILLVFWIGIYPNSFLSFMHVSVQHLMERVNMGGVQEANIAKTIMEVVR